MMRSRQSYPIETRHSRSDGSRTFAFFALMLLGVTIAFLMLANGAKTWFVAGQRNAPDRDNVRSQRQQREVGGRPSDVQDQVNLVNQPAQPLGDVRQRAEAFLSQSMPDPNATELRPGTPSPGNSQSGRMITGHVTHGTLDGRGSRNTSGQKRLQLTIPSEFAAADRSAPTGDELVRDRDWRKQFQPAPPLEPAVARTSLTEIRPYQEWDVHQTASDSLGRIGVAAVPSLIRALSNRDPKRRAEAAWLLGRIGPDASSAVDALVVALSDTETSVQKSAARALGQIGPDAAKAVDALMRVVQETEPIGVTGDPDTVPSQYGVAPRIAD